MDKETYARQAPFAGKKKPSMQRRCVGHDYTSRRLYMLTMVVEGRRPLLGTLVGSTANEARVEPSELGLRVEREWWGIPRYHPEIEMVALQLMPDHLHGILFVREQMACDLSRVVRGFKTGCHRAIRELGLSPLVATQSQPTSKSHPKHGLLFAPGYNDRILRRYGQLDTWRAYLRDNPRRLFVRREHPDYFRVRFGLHIGSQTYSALGNRFLLSWPDRQPVQCSRRLTEAEIQQRVSAALEAARQGCVHISPAISKGEKAIMRALLDAGYPLVYLEENGLTPYTKPGGELFEACARGQLLILAPWEHHNERLLITRDRCLALNAMAQELSALSPFVATESQQTSNNY